MNRALAHVVLIAGVLGAGWWAARRTPVVD
jgi:hypothetical protein